MNNKFTAKQKKLLIRLSAAAKWPQRKHLIRVLAHPGRMLYPRILKAIGRDMVVKARTFWGGEIAVILPEDVSIYIWRYGYFEEDVCIYLLSLLQEGMTFVDIGSHFGFFTILGSHLVGETGKVLAFEPTPNTYQQLKRNVTHCSNVDVSNCAAYSVDEKIRFYDYGLTGSAFNSILGSRKNHGSPNPKSEISVQARRIDSILRERGIKKIDLVKIDAESSEINVLEGMMETLKNCRPNLVLEVGDFEVKGASNSKDVVKLLLQMNYSAYEVSGEKIVPHLLEERYEYGNLLFLPNS